MGFNLKQKQFFKYFGKGYRTLTFFLRIIANFKNVWMICSMLILSWGGGGWGGGINSPFQWRILGCGSSFSRYWSGSRISKMFWIRIPHLLKKWMVFLFVFLNYVLKFLIKWSGSATLGGSCAGFVNFWVSFWCLCKGRLDFTMFL
jgi:hypothetical protein